MKKRTKQGVLDLNSLPSQSRGIKLAAPPTEAFTGLQCEHPSDQVFGHSSGHAKCHSCNNFID